MNAIKQIPIAKIMASLGIPAVKQRGNTITIHAVGRADKHPSMTVDTNSNRWKDWSTGENGSNVDFIMKAKRWGYGQAMDWLKELDGQDTQPLSFSKGATIEKSSKIEIIHTEEIKAGDPIWYYLKGRGITTIEPYIRKVYYQNKGCQFYAAGWQDEALNWHLRSKTFKGCTGQGITLIENGSDAMIITEGMMSWLSLIQIYPIYGTYDVIILNSVANIRKAINKAKNHEKIHLLLDNDESGNKATESLMKAIPQATDCRSWYAPHNDINIYINLNKN